MKTGHSREEWDAILSNEIKNNGQPERLIPDFFDDEDLEDWTW